MIWWLQLGQDRIHRIMYSSLFAIFWSCDITYCHKR